jgi:hypothetical protein
MADSLKVTPGGESGPHFEAACEQVLNLTRARCAAVIVIDGEDGSGYSVKGPMEAQVLLPVILQQMADALRTQLARNMQ